MKKFSIKNRYGLEIVGNILKPENSIGLSFVVHGLGSTRKQTTVSLLSNILLENNYTVVNFDATNSVGESGGKYEDATLGKHYEDLVDVINWSKNQDWYREPFVLVGSSLGGYAVAKYAEDLPNEVKAVFPKACVISGNLRLEAYDRKNPEKNKKWKETGWYSRMSNSVPGLEFKLPWSHIEERLNHDLKIKAQNLTMPVLMVVGENDDSCPPDHQKSLFDLIPQNPKNEFHIVKGAPHSFKEPDHLNELGSIFNNWIKQI